ncbi:MAG: sulfatase [Elusimicrobia bacterium]|nr:sulfatase [Elusimicrobiota bacterium]
MNLRMLTLACSLPLAGATCFAGSGVEYQGNYNVVLILMETLRPDHLGCYGYRRRTSPNIDRLAAESAVFENAFAQSSQSLISAASVFTGLYPPSHGVVNVTARLAPGVATLAGELKRHGYKTAAFTGGFFLNRSFGLNGGFAVYDDSRDFGTLHDIVPCAVKWLRENGKKKFFLLVHGYDAHAPYRAPKEFLDKFSGGYDGRFSALTLDYYLADRIYKDGLYEDFRLKKKIATLDKKDVDYIVSQYDGAVLYADSYIGVLLSEIEAQGLKDKTLILFAASAGEALMDHGTIISSFHGGLYDEGIHVPLLIRVPGAGASRIQAEAQLVDVMPTVLNLLQFSVPEAVQGISLKPALGREGRPAPDRLAYAQTLSLTTGDPYIGARKYPWKLILGDGRRELFNLADDPKEQKDLAGAHPEILKLRSAELDRLVKALPRSRAGNYQRPLAIVSERMKQLGYWWMDRPRVDFWDEQRRKTSRGKK